MLLGIILLPLLARFSLICRMWAFQIIHDRPLGRADWAFVLGWNQGPGCFTGRVSSLDLASGLASSFFKLYQYIYIMLFSYHDHFLFMILTISTLVFMFLYFKYFKFL